MDAFFEEVQEVEKNVVEEVDGNQTTDTNKTVEEEPSIPPAKRQKTNSTAARPRGVVVASSTSVILPADKRETNPEQNSSASSQQQSSSYNKSNAYNQHTPRVGPVGPHVGPALPPAGPSVGPHSIGPTYPGVIGTNNSPPNSNSGNNEAKHSKPVVRMAAGKVWKDESLAEWPENDYRIFVGNLTNDVDDEMLYQHFSKYPSLAKAKVVRHNNNPEKSKGYGFVSLLDPLECARAIREMDQTWLSARPIRVKRSDWKERDFKQVKKKQKKENKQQKRMGLNF